MSDSLFLGNLNEKRNENKKTTSYFTWGWFSCGFWWSDIRGGASLSNTWWRISSQLCPHGVWYYCFVFCSQLLPIHTLRLGMEVDSFDGHHYISSIAPGGPIDTLSLLQPEDELLEVRFMRDRQEFLSSRNLYVLTELYYHRCQWNVIYLEWRNLVYCVLQGSCKILNVLTTHRHKW